MTFTDEVRAFNRFYTREIGLLNRSLPATDLSLPEARVLYELAQAPEGGRTAAEIGRTLDMDKAHLSRIVARFVTRGLASGRVSPNHRKHRLISLTDAGRKVFAGAEAAARGQVDALLEPIDLGGRSRIIEAMRDIRMALKDREAGHGQVSLRPLRSGDVGWIIHRQAALYTQEYGWDWTYEGLASRILGAFVAEFDASREDGWVAERGGATVGSIFLMKSDDPRTPPPPSPPPTPPALASSPFLPSPQIRYRANCPQPFRIALSCSVMCGTTQFGSALMLAACAFAR